MDPLDAGNFAYPLANNRTAVLTVLIWNATNCKLLYQSFCFDTSQLLNLTVSCPVLSLLQTTHHDRETGELFSVWIWMGEKEDWGGLILLIQTIIVCLIRGKIYRRFRFSYILFIIIIGGRLVLFIYITRLASNEIFSPSNKILVVTLILLLSSYYI